MAVSKLSPTLLVQMVMSPMSNTKEKLLTQNTSHMPNPLTNHIQPQLTNQPQSQLTSQPQPQLTNQPQYITNPPQFTTNPLCTTQPQFTTNPPQYMPHTQPQLTSLSQNTLSLL